jgi:hypothetical protein
MTGSWKNAEAQNAAEVLSEFGQEIKFLPMKREPNRRSVWDPDRESFTFCGVCEQPSSLVAQKGTDLEIATRNPIIFARRQDLPYMPQTMDRFSTILYDRLTIFEINQIEPDGRSGIMFILNQIGPPL